MNLFKSVILHQQTYRMNGAIRRDLPFEKFHEWMVKFWWLETRNVVVTLLRFPQNFNNEEEQ